MSVTDIRTNARKVFESGDPNAFTSLLQELFSSTVLASGEIIKLRRLPKGGFNFSGRELGAPLKLNNDKYLKFFLASSPGRYISINSAVLQYQADSSGGIVDDFYFRYDYALDPEPNHPPSHLQLKSSGFAIDSVDIKQLRFPANRPSIESILRFLINDFGIEPNKPSEWQEILAVSEQLFYDYIAKKRLPPL